MTVRACAAVIWATAAAILAAGPLAAQKRGPAQSPQRDFGAALPAAGLTMRFHDNANCAPISSPYGSPTRYDGSSRQVGGGPGSTHGGIDLTLKEGTPLLAIAAGTAFAMGEGGQMEGNYLWLLHLPARSGLPFAFLSKYQHLMTKPSLGPDNAVSLGEEVARSGLTGTVGGHYGPNGYAHLHLTVRAVPDDKIAIAAGSRDAFLIQRDSIQIDPLTVYAAGLRSPAKARDLPPERKQVVVAFVDGRHVVRPASARVVWPVACP